MNVVCQKFKREAKEGRTFELTSARLWNSVPEDNFIIKEFLQLL